MGGRVVLTGKALSEEEAGGAGPRRRAIVAKRNKIILLNDGPAECFSPPVCSSFPVGTTGQVVGSGPMGGIS